EIVGCIIVSGLSHEQDHQLIVDALYQYQNRKVLASDIDGTLVFHQLDGLYRPNDLIAIKEFQNQGHLFGVCSGRPLCHFKDMRRLNLDFYIVSSGAVILDKDFHIIEEYPMAKDIAKSLCERYQDKAGIIVQSSSLNRFYATCCDFDCQDLYIFHDFQEIEEEKIYGISLIAKSEEEAKQLNIDIAHHYPELEGFQNTDSVDIVMRGCSKGKAVIKIKELLRVKEIAGIGVSYNDIPLLQNADVGFTFHDSPQIVKDQATYIVDSVDQAIAQLMEETV
ncbi:MAG: HAD-IIB family hydrolase, partial [Faecalibacillus sp.]